MEMRDFLVPIRDEDTGYTTGYAKESVEMLLEQQERAERQRQGMREKREYEQAALRDQRHYLMCYDGGRETAKDQQLSDLGVLFKLTAALQFDGEGLLAQARSKDGSLKPLSKAALTKLLGKSKNGIDGAVERLERVGAIRVERSKGSRKSYYISEDLVRIGKNKNRDKENFTKVYRTKAKQLLKKLTDAEAGFIFKCLPFLHYSTHVLVLFPHERDLTKVQPIRGEDLADQLGIGHGRFRNLSSLLKRKGAIMFLDVGTEGKGYVLNPSLCDRGFRSEYTERARAYFTMFEKDENNA